MTPEQTDRWLDIEEQKAKAMMEVAYAIDNLSHTFSNTLGDGKGGKYLLGISQAMHMMCGLDPFNGNRDENLGLKININKK